jgi:hypothetical protein
MPHLAGQFRFELAFHEACWIIASCVTRPDPCALERQYVEVESVSALGAADLRAPDERTPVGRELVVVERVEPRPAPAHLYFTAGVEFWFPEGQYFRSCVVDSGLSQLFGSFRDGQQKDLLTTFGHDSPAAALTETREWGVLQPQLSTP